MTITGSDLGNTVEVQFGLASAIFDVISDELLVATVPLDATTGPISVVSTEGLAVTFAHFIVAPRVLELIPSSAPIGASILIEGQNFEGATVVRFSGTNALANFSVNSPTQIEAIVPAGATNGPITVVSPAGTGRSEESFTVLGRTPFISSFNPTRGEPGTVVTIEGLNFAGATAVRFKDQAATFGVTSPTQIRATVPAGAATGPISVVTPVGTGISKAVFTVTTAPIIDRFSPSGGPPGTPVVIEGQNFTGATAVRFAGRNATFSVPAPTQINATVPAGATNGVITVVTPRGTGQSSEPFLASTGPIIAEFAPTNGPPNTTVTIQGANFVGVRSVRLNNAEVINFSAPAPTQINFVVPANATSGRITVTTAAGSATTVSPFLVRTGRPVITDFDPPAGPPRSTVRIEGVDFSGATRVLFNGIEASFAVVADTQISALVPNQATSGPISVTAAGGTGVSSNRFILAPSITGFSPARGAAGTSVTIQGRNLTDLLDVRFKEVSSAFRIISATSVSTTVPAEATTGSINLISPAGIVATTNFFVVLPAITGFSPLRGGPGTQVSIFGSGFSEVIAIRFGGIDATTASIVSSTQIVAVVPPGAVTGPITVITTADSAVSARSFSVGVAADLAVSQSQSTNTVLQNQPLTYTIAVTNRGPSAASAVVVSNTLPAGVVVTAATASQGTVQRTDRLITVALGALNSGTAASLVVTVIPTASGPMTNRVAVAGGELDPDPSNNSSTLSSQVLANPAMLRLERLAGNNLRISWPVAATDFVLQSAERLAAGSSWETVTTPPVIVGNQKAVTIAPGAQTRFYRLARP